MPVENTVFISYRRVNFSQAIAVQQYLKSKDYDVFLDTQSIPAGLIKPVVIREIQERTYFILILTTDTLKRCNEPDDWVRLEIETAIECNRVIVPLIFPPFEWKRHSKYLPDSLTLLKDYNGLQIPNDYFEDAMSRLCERFLKPTQLDVESLSDEQLLEILLDDSSSSYRDYDLSELYYKAYTDFYSGFSEYAIEDFTFIIDQDVNYWRAYAGRGEAYSDIGEIEKAILDYSKVIELNPSHIQAHVARAGLYRHKEEYDKAIDDYLLALTIETNNELWGDEFWHEIARKELKEILPFA